jgi:hypothetical protein
MKLISATLTIASSGIWKYSNSRGIIKSKFRTKLLKSITTYSILAWVFLLASALGLTFIIAKLDPSKLTHTLLFYFDIFVLMYCLTLLAGFYMRQAFGVREFARAHMALAARQSLWFGLMLAISFLLLAFDLFTWLNAILLMLCLTFLESYFLFK